MPSPSSCCSCRTQTRPLAVYIYFCRSIFRVFVVPLPSLFCVIQWLIYAIVYSCLDLRVLRRLSCRGIPTSLNNCKRQLMSGILSMHFFHFCIVFGNRLAWSSIIAASNNVPCVGKNGESRRQFDNILLNAETLILHVNGCDFTCE